MFLTELLEGQLTGITLLYGPGASGKTTACLSALTGRSVFITTGRNFTVDRLRSLRKDADAIIAKLALFEPQNADELEQAVKAAVKLSEVSSLIVVDTITTHIRSIDRKLGNLLLHRVLAELSASKCPVLITSEVYGSSDGSPIRYIGGDMLRLAAHSIVELTDGIATVKKNPLHTGRSWRYRIADHGLEKV